MALHLWLYPQVTGKGMGDIDGAKYSPGWGSWNVSQAGSLSLLQGEVRFLFCSGIWITWTNL